MNPFLLLSISQRDYEIKLGLRISAVGESLQFYFSAKQEHSSRLKQRADFLRILLKNRLGGKRGEIGPNSESVAALNLPIGKLFRALRVSRAAIAGGSTSYFLVPRV